MALQRRKILKQMLNRGYGTDTVPADGGGSLTGDKVGIHTFLNTPHLLATDFEQTTLGANIAAAIAAAPSSGATIYCDAISNGTISTDLFSGVTKPVRLEFAPGTYTITTQQNVATSAEIVLSPGTTINLQAEIAVDAGVGFFTLRGAGYASYLKLTGASNRGVHLVGDAGVDGGFMVLDNFRIEDHTSAGTTAAVHLEGVSGFWISHLTLLGDNEHGYGVWLEGSQQGQLSDSVIHWFAEQIRFNDQHGSAGDVSCNAVEIHGNNISGQQNKKGIVGHGTTVGAGELFMHDNHITVGGPSGGGGTGISLTGLQGETHVQRVHLEYCDVGIEAYSGSVRIMDCDIYCDVGGTDILLDGTAASVVGPGNLLLRTTNITSNSTKTRFFGNYHPNATITINDTTAQSWGNASNYNPPMDYESATFGSLVIGNESRATGGTISAWDSGSFGPSTNKVVCSGGGVVNNVMGGGSFVLGSQRTGSGNVFIDYPSAGGLFIRKTGLGNFGVSLGFGAPSADCSTGALYVNLSGGTSTTLYVCKATNTWAAVTTA